MGIGKDHTIFSLIDGLVKFEKFGPDKKKVQLFLNILRLQIHALREVHTVPQADMGVGFYVIDR